MLWVLYRKQAFTHLLRHADEEKAPVLTEGCQKPEVQLLFSCFPVKTRLRPPTDLCLTENCLLNTPFYTPLVSVMKYINLAVVLGCKFSSWTATLMVDIKWSEREPWSQLYLSSISSILPEVSGYHIGGDVVNLVSFTSPILSHRTRGKCMGSNA